MDDLEVELKRLIVESLSLEDVRAEEIESEAPLFGSGLGLDSVDALELAMAVSRKYGVHIDADNEANQRVFHSVQSLAAFIRAERARA
jgi:acyl carrier protein